jgi:signal peptidase I
MEDRRFWLREYFEALLIAGIFLGFTNTFVVKTFYIPSGSMEDTLLIGDHLFVNRYVFGHAASPWEQRWTPLRDVRRGDIVIFRSPETPTTDLVKRCVGLPGDRIQIIRKQLWVNGKAAKDGGYARHADPETFPEHAFPNQSDTEPMWRQRDNFGPFVVPEDHYFFLGDNRDYSYDSRYWGVVPRYYLKGRALMIYWSFGGTTPDGQWNGWGQKLKQIGRTAGGFLTETRWRRSFHLVR